MISIYILERNNIPFYVGKTNNLKNRLANHKKKFGKEIQIIELDKVPMHEWLFWENHYISLIKSWGFNLLNKNNGGGGSTEWSIEQKIKQSLKQKGLRKVGAGQYIRTPYHKSRLQNTHKLSKEHIDKLNEARKYIDQDLKGKKISEKLKGRAITWKLTHSELTKQNISYKNKINKLNKKSIIKMDLQNNYLKEYRSISDACRDIDLSKWETIRSSISDCLRGKTKTSYGFKWIYKI